MMSNGTSVNELLDSDPVYTVWADKADAELMEHYASDPTYEDWVSREEKRREALAGVNEGRMSTDDWLKYHRELEDCVPSDDEIAFSEPDRAFYEFHCL